MRIVEETIKHEKRMSCRFITAILKVLRLSSAKEAVLA